MQTILVAGAGKSSIYLIKYLLSHAPRNKWKVIVADGDKSAVADKINNNAFAEGAEIDVTSERERQELVKKADIVVSLMPPHLHSYLAKDCLQFKKNLITSSYISADIQEMDKHVKDAGLMFMCEMGLDPGIDHMTASQIIHSIQRVASVITSFKSYCGGLVAPEYDNNPWHYKFSWNPKNIVSAGVGGAAYLSNGKEIEIPYDKIFTNNKRVKVDGVGSLAYYANRDSLRYLDLYDIPEIKSFMRATLRHPQFCKGWNALIALGLTGENDAFDTGGHTNMSWCKNASGYNNGIPFPEYLQQKLELEKEDKIIHMLEWLGLFEEMALPAGKCSSAQILLSILLNKWKMEPAEKDMVVMQHEVEYTHKDHKIKVTNSMNLRGENSYHSAMAKTVGLPMGILARMTLNKKLNPAPVGVHIPNMPSVYRPVLTELQHHGISFKDEVV
ncbi:MAG: saccharopine dehydrogenase NADP-binding domain-containing protein [Taibaiella sp.]|nr:saccharopine dehydrogenase NADP-binding domain-containing protein [Taibaiella sp.]